MIFLGGCDMKKMFVAMNWWFSRVTCSLGRYVQHHSFMKAVSEGIAFSRYTVLILTTLYGTASLSMFGTIKGTTNHSSDPIFPQASTTSTKTTIHNSPTQTKTRNSKKPHHFTLKPPLWKTIWSRIPYLSQFPTSFNPPATPVHRSTDWTVQR